MKINDLVARRTDLSTFLVHLTRDGEDDDSAKKRLKSILKKEVIEARNPFGMAYQRLKDKELPTKSQNCVCFTETPLEHVHLLIGDIKGRKCQMSSYGVAITKKQGRKRGVNPIWYVDITKGHDWLTEPLNRLISAVIKEGKFDKSDISQIAPFIEPMGSGSKPEGGRYRKEFWWEREWRHQGDFNLPERLIVLCPAEDRKELRTYVKELSEGDGVLKPAFIDPKWSLEQIIGNLAKIGDDDIGPF